MTIIEVVKSFEPKEATFILSPIDTDTLLALKSVVAFALDVKVDCSLELCDLKIVFLEDTSAVLIAEETFKDDVKVEL